METVLTLLVAEAQSGNRWAINRLAELTYDRLRSSARVLIARERLGHTLQATALVHELFLHKFRNLQANIVDSEHFYSLAARAMKQVLIDHARTKAAQKRQVSPGAIADFLRNANESPLPTEMRLAIQQALTRLERIDPKSATAIRCRFVEGHSIPGAAAVLQRTEKRIRIDCEFGLSWMARHLESRPHH